MQVASLQAATSKLQQNISQLPESGNVGAIGRCLLSVNQTDVNSISLFGEKVNINKTKSEISSFKYKDKLSVYHEC